MVQHDAQPGLFVSARTLSVRSGKYVVGSQLSRDYHHSELAIARDPENPAHILPPPLAVGSRVLDVGCGAGQTLLTAYPQQRCVGIDVDLEALKLGRSWSFQLPLVCSRAENLPFASASFDAVIARVSLAYTDLSCSLPEIHRVLRKGGLLWLVLHPFHVPFQTAREGGPKAWLFFAYIAANSLLFHTAGRMFRLLGRCESFQTASGMQRALHRRGFHHVHIERGRHFVIAATAR